MLNRLPSGRTVLSAACMAAIVVSAANGAQARGADRGSSPRTCASVYRSGLKLEQAARLREAQKVFLTCARPSCGALMRQECTIRFTRLENDIPSVIPVVADENGAPVTGVRVLMDGELLTSQIDGRALSVDPGVHEFAFRGDGGVLSTQRMVILQGQRNRPITVTLRAGDRSVVSRSAPPQPRVTPPTLVQAPPPPAAVPTLPPSPALSSTAEEPAPAAPADEPPAPAAPSRLGPALLAGVGVVGVGGFSLLTMWGRKDNQMLAGCAPDCAQASVDHIRKLYRAADVSLGVGLAALGAAATWALVNSRSSHEEVAANHPTYQLNVQPTPKGALASVAGSF